MMENIKKLGLLSDMLTSGDGGEDAKNFDIYEFAHIAHVMGGIDNALQSFNESEYWYGRNSEIKVFYNQNLDMFKVVNAIFDWVADEIIETRLHTEKEGGTYKGAIKISDDRNKEIEILKSKMLYDYRGNFTNMFESIEVIIKKYLDLYMKSNGNETYINLHHGVYKNKLYVVLESWT